MIEQKLQLAADALPKPVCEFPVYQRKTRKRWNRKLVIIVAALITVLTIATGYTYSKATYCGWAGIYSREFIDAKWRAGKFSLTLPETLLGVPFSYTSEMYVVPTGTPRLVAILNPYYHPYWVVYEILREEVIDEKTTHHWSENDITVSFGTTTQETWKYYYERFETENDKNWAGRNLVPETYQEVSYEGYTIEIGSTWKDWGSGIAYSHYAQYEDEERQVFISISAEDLETALAAAKEIIDLNK